MSVPTIADLDAVRIAMGGAGGYRRDIDAVAGNLTELARAAIYALWSRGWVPPADVRSEATITASSNIHAERSEAKGCQLND